jgi:hypothetical protein
LISSPRGRGDIDEIRIAIFLSAASVAARTSFRDDVKVRDAIPSLVWAMPDEAPTPSAVIAKVWQPASTTAITTHIDAGKIFAPLVPKSASPS